MKKLYIRWKLLAGMLLAPVPIWLVGTLCTLNPNFTDWEIWRIWIMLIDIWIVVGQIVFVMIKDTRWLNRLLINIFEK